MKLRWPPLSFSGTERKNIRLPSLDDKGADLRAGSRHAVAQMIKDKVKTGVSGLDEMMEGGLIPGRAYVVSGTSGTGKTTLAMQFLLDGAKNGERVIYVALDEPPNEIKQNMRSYGWDIDRVQVFDATPDIMSYDKTPVRDVSTERKVTYFKEVGECIRQTSEKSPADMTINTIQEILKQEMKVRKYTRIVIDSLTSLRYFYIRTSEENATLMSFFRLLSDLGVTSMLTMQLAEISKPDIEIHVARGEIRLHKWINGRGLMRGITIEKYRGSAHDHRLRTMKISADGIVIKKAAQEKDDGEDEGSDEASPGAPEAPPAAPLTPAPQAPQPVPDKGQETPVEKPKAEPPQPAPPHEGGGSGI